VENENNQDKDSQKSSSMINQPVIPQLTVDKAYEELKQQAEQRGYHLNPDVSFTKALIHGLLRNEQRYGYQACPCRLASGNRKQDLDIICPCDYRDADLNEFSTCFCGLYVTSDVIKGKKKIGSVPERRPGPEERKKMQEMKEKDVKEKAVKEKNAQDKGQTTLPALPIWRCKVCGYLCARNDPPDNCPICGVAKDRFERFM